MLELVEKLLGIRRTKMNKRIGKWKYIVAVASLLMLMQPLTAQAAKIPLKPGATVTPTAKETLQVSTVGFQDESYCTIINSACYDKKYATSWAFSVKNLSPTRSVTNIKAKITFFDEKGDTLYQGIVSVAHELKPGKTTYSAADSNGSNSSFTGAKSATVDILSKGWIVPTKSIVQNSTFLDLTLNEYHSIGNYCSLLLSCKENDPSHANYLQPLNLSGTFTWRGSDANRGGLLIYLGSLGNIMGGWLNTGNPIGAYIPWDGNTFKAATYIVKRNNFYLTSYEIANIVNYMFITTT